MEPYSGGGAQARRRHTEPFLESGRFGECDSRAKRPARTLRHTRLSGRDGKQAVRESRGNRTESRLNVRAGWVKGIPGKKVVLEMQSPVSINRKYV